MAEMLGIVEIAKRLKVDGTTVRRLIAKESESLGLQVHRGKGDKTLLTKDDAEKVDQHFPEEKPATTYLQNKIDIALEELAKLSLWSE